MKKTLIALAAVAATSAAFAQSNVTIYGQVDLWLGKVTTKDSFEAPTTKESSNLMESGGLAASRIGFKGQEDLGGGLKATFQLEQGFDADTGTTTVEKTAFDRQATIGLIGGFGEVQLGRNTTAYEDTIGIANNNFDSAFTARPSFFGYTARGNNTIKYVSPEFSGITGAFSYSLGEDKVGSGTKASSITAFTLTYAAGPLTVGFGTQSEKAGSDFTKVGIAPSGLVFDFIDDDYDAEEFEGLKLKNNQLSAVYDLGVVKLMGNLTRAKLSGPDGYSKSNEYSLGLEYPVSSSLTLAAGFGQAKLKEDGSNVAKLKSTGLSLSYALSKRTTGYAGFSNLKFTSNGEAGNVKVNGFAVGVNHKF